MTEDAQAHEAQGHEAETPDSESHDTCSARGCAAGASWALLWNNPRLHTPERRKVWLACDEHRITLSEFLAARHFLREVVVHEPGVAHGTSGDTD